MDLKKIIVFKIGRVIPDKLWIQLKYFQWFKRLPNLSNPKTFNEKLNWMKLYDRRPEYSKMVDKYEAKKYIAERVGEKYIIPVLGGPWNSFEEIDLKKLPKQFVLKTTHDCGGVVVCKDKNKFDREKAKKFLTEHLKNNYYLTCREWPYKHVKPRIFAEKYLKDSREDEQLTDYKFFCFNGVPKIMFIATDRISDLEETKFDFFDMEFNHLPIIQGHPNAHNAPKCPNGFEEMKKIASKLSQGIPQIRIDFYESEGKIYVGELTLFHFSGNVPFNSEEWDLKLGSWINLDECKVR